MMFKDASSPACTTSYVRQLNGASPQKPGTSPTLLPKMTATRANHRHPFLLTYTIAQIHDVLCLEENLSPPGNTLDLMLGEKTVENRRLQLLICQGYVEQSWESRHGKRHGVLS